MPVVIYAGIENGLPKIVKGRVVGFFMPDNPVETPKLEIETKIGFFWRDPAAVYETEADLIADLPNLID